MEAWDRLVDSLPDAVVAMDTEFRVRSWNRAAERIYGWTTPEAMGRDIVELLQTQIVDGMRQDVRRLLLGGEAWRGEVYQVRKDGSRVLLFTSAAAIRNEAGDTVGFVNVNSETNHARETRFSAIGQLAVSVAHEINNPIAFIKMNQDMMTTRLRELREHLAKPGGSEMVLRVVADLEDMLIENSVGVDRVTAIVRDLRTRAREEKEQASRVDVSQVCREVCVSVASQVEARARLVADVKDVPALTGDPRKLERVVTSLIVNAVQAIPPGDPGNNEIRLTTGFRNGAIVVTVSHTGQRPLAPETAPVADLARPGSAEIAVSHLTAAAAIVSGFGGMITAGADEGGARRIEVVLPVSADRFAAPLSEPPPPPVERERLSVLLIDDDVMLAHSFAKVLAPHHDVVLATSGREGIEILEQRQTFDVVLCDLTMMDLDGPAVHAAIVERWPALAERFLAITGGAVNERAQAFVDAHASRILEKPIAPAELRRVIESVGRR